MASRVKGLKNDALKEPQSSKKADVKLDKHAANVLPDKERKSHKDIHCPICSEIIQDSVGKKEGTRLDILRWRMPAVGP